MVRKLYVNEAFLGCTFVFISNCFTLVRALLHSGIS
jgi:hypothetical protein